MARNLEQYENQKRWRAEHPERVKALRIEWYKRHPTYKRSAFLRKQYGITLEDYENMLKAQGGVCAICKRDDPRRTRNFHIDHDHETGRVRGLLCYLCNMSLGWLEKGNLRDYLARSQPLGLG